MPTKPSSSPSPTTRPASAKVRRRAPTRVQRFGLGGAGGGGGVGARRGTGEPRAGGGVGFATTGSLPRGATVVFVGRVKAVVGARCGCTNWILKRGYFG